MKIERVWSMPNKHTFLITPIKQLLKQHINGGLWGDPYSGYNSPAQLKNDLNPNIPADSHMDALDWLKTYSDNHFDGIIYDPPYSPTQLKRSYDFIGLKPNPEIYKSNFYSKQKDEIARIVKPGGKVICCGWNSSGVGKTRGFQLLQVLLVSHGGNRNDTIITVERKINESLI